jgi:hypothetical protein
MHATKETVALRVATVEYGVFFFWDSGNSGGGESMAWNLYHGASSSGHKSHLLTNLIILTLVFASAVYVESDNVCFM